MGTKIKICGLTTPEDINAVNKYLPEYVGFVLFFPKSKRNVLLEDAIKLKSQLKKDIKTVAVVVTPTEAQIKSIQNAGFHYIQIHGELLPHVYRAIEIPIIRAFHVDEFDQFYQERQASKIIGFVFDSKEAGSGKTFNWELLKNLDTKEKLFFLAGGINEENVKEAIKTLHPDVIDLSSSVEKETMEGIFVGKDPKKIKKMIRMVHYAE